MLNAFVFTAVVLLLHICLQRDRSGVIEVNSCYVEQKSKLMPYLKKQDLVVKNLLLLVGASGKICKVSGSSEQWDRLA